HKNRATLRVAPASVARRVDSRRKSALAPLYCAPCQRQKVKPPSQNELRVALKTEHGKIVAV
ncbi:hypothetical protein A2U01_0072457, partial [Trifolium medium]|nr:hypothetical protein [Trifolium medium]